jgi:polar amino acid transport system substrate-binding protein
MVKTGIADASFGAEDTHRSAASMNGNKAAEFSYSPVFRQTTSGWPARSTSPKKTRKWRTAMEALRADGTIGRIVHKYAAMEIRMACAPP